MTIAGSCSISCSTDCPPPAMGFDTPLECCPCIYRRPRVSMYQKEGFLGSPSPSLANCICFSDRCIDFSQFHLKNKEEEMFPTFNQERYDEYSREVDTNIPHY